MRLGENGERSTEFGPLQKLDKRRDGSKRKKREKPERKSSMTCTEYICRHLTDIYVNR